MSLLRENAAMTHEGTADQAQQAGTSRPAVPASSGSETRAQESTGRAATDATAQGAPAERQHSGRPTSWAAVAVIIAGFVAGGLGLVLGPTWWLFWVGAGLTVAGGIFGLATGIMEDYTTEAH